MTESTINTTKQTQDLQSIFHNFSLNPEESHREYWEEKCGYMPENVRYGKRDGKPVTVIPYQNIQEKISTLQYVPTNKTGLKMFHKGVSSSGSFSPITPIERADIVFLVEGYATAISLNKIVSEMRETVSVVSCASVSNIPKVAKALKEKYQKITIIIAFDRPRDYTKADPVYKSLSECRGLGIKKFVFPLLEGSKEDYENNVGGRDWNDAFKEQSADEILSHIEEQIDTCETTELFKEQSQTDGELDLDTPLLKLEPFPFHFLPKQTMLYAKELAEKNMVADSIVGGSILAFCSLAVQANVEIVTSHTKHPLSLFVLTVAESGEGKTTIEKHLKQAVEYKEEFDYNSYRDELQLFYHQEKIWKKETEGLSSEEFISYIKTHPKPKRPPEPKLIMSDATTEGILKQFDRGKSSLGLFTAEGGRVFGGYSMSKEKEVHTIGTLSCLWDGDPVERTRGDEKEGMKLFHKNLTANIMIQNKLFDSVWKNELMQEQGILSRFLVARPEPKSGTRIRGLDPLNFEYESEFRKSISYLLNKSENVPEKRLIPLSAAAHRLNIEYYNSVEKEAGVGGRYQDLKPFASKSAEQARRIAGVITLMENPEAEEIDNRSMERGISLARWYLDEALRISKEENQSYEESGEKKLLQLLEKKGAMPLRFIVQNFPNRKLRKIKFITPLLDSLEKKHKIKKNEINMWQLVS